jgi:hypothetical protein
MVGMALLRRKGDYSANSEKARTRDREGGQQFFGVRESKTY